MTNGTAALLGDAAHPMMPFMAQGAGNGDWVYGYDAWRVPLPA